MKKIERGGGGGMLVCGVTMHTTKQGVQDPPPEDFRNLKPLRFNLLGLSRQKS